MFAKREDQSSGVGAAAESAPPVGPGYVLGGTYRVERALGRDALGHVAAATHVRDKDRVTLRFLRPEGAAGAARAAGLVREARRAAGSDNEHVARVLEVGALADGTPFVVTEYLEGRDLGARLREGPSLSPSEAVEYVIQACAGLAEAHATGAAHGAVKPENLFLTRHPDGAPLLKVLGFGAGKFAPRGAQLPRADGGAEGGGASVYSSPEQLNAGEVDARADVWALGAVLFELLTGRPAFPAASLPELRSMVFEQPAPRASAFRPEVSAGLDEAIARCLERAPGARFANVVEVGVALLPFAPRRARAAVDRAAAALGPTPARPGGARAPSAPLSPPAAAASGPPPPGAARAPARPATAAEWRAQKRTLQVGTAAGLLMIAAGMVGWVLERRAPAPPDAAAERPADVAPPPAPSAPEAGAPAGAAADAPDKGDAAAPADSARGAAKGGAHRPRPPRPLPPNQTPTAPPAAPRSSPDLEIRLKR